MIKEDFDYYGVAAIGDIKYKDGFDKWDDIKKVIESKEEVDIVTKHNSKDIIGKIRHFDLCDKNKELQIGINKKDLNVGIDAFNAVSPQWVVDDNDRIIDINHIAVGNSFEPFCSTNICNITKNRGKNKMSEDNEEMISVSKKDWKDLISKNEVLGVRLAALEEALITPSADGEEEEKEKPDEEIKEKQDIKQDISTSPSKDKGYTNSWDNLYDITQNTIDVHGKYYTKEG